MSDQERLAGYVDVWWRGDRRLHPAAREAARRAVVDADRPARVGRPRVRRAHRPSRVGARRAAPEETIQVEARPARRVFAGLYTEQGVVARRDATPDALINEIRECATKRRTPLLEDAADRRVGAARRHLGDIHWDWQMLLRNRPLDVWMHEQDVRRAVGRPGGLDSRCRAAHGRLPAREPWAWCWPSGPARPPGRRSWSRSRAARPRRSRSSDTGRGTPLPDVPDDPTVRLTMARETFVVLAGGRRPPDRVGTEDRRRRGPRAADPGRDGDHPVSWSVADIPPS